MHIPETRKLTHAPGPLSKASRAGLLCFQLLVKALRQPLTNERWQRGMHWTRRRPRQRLPRRLHDSLSAGFFMKTSGASIRGERNRPRTCMPKPVDPNFLLVLR